MKRKNLVLTIIFITVLSTTSFFVGYKYGKSRNNPISFNRDQMRGEMPSGGDFVASRGNSRVGNGMVNNQVSGEIIKIDSNSLTIKLVDGGSSAVYFGEDIYIGKMTQIDRQELTEGSQVLVLGSTGTDGNFIAESIQIR